MSTKVLVEKIGAYKFQGKNAQGKTVTMDGPKSIGGGEDGFRPMEMLLAGMAGCSAMDIVSILEKQRQDLKGLRIELEGERATEHPKVYTAIRVHFILEGPMDEKKVERAVELSMDKYCSAAAMMKAMAEIKYSFELR